MNQQALDQRSVGPLTIVAFGLIALTILCAQIVLARLFAGTLTYYFAFMLISLAMLGLGSGGLIVQLASSFFAFERLGVQASWLSILMGFSGSTGTLAMLSIYPKLSVHEGFVVLGSTFWCFVPFFLCGGIIVSLVLCRWGKRDRVGGQRELPVHSGGVPRVHRAPDAQRNHGLHASPGFS